MTIVGFHASHEQLPPSALRDAVVRAEEVGFEAAMGSDHLAPWGVRQGHSGFAWSWLGAALQATRLPFGVVTSPGQRYHPVIIAQAIATLGELFPGRFWAALGSGEAVNEHVTGDAWPPKPQRDARLRESADIIRRLLSGERVDHEGMARVHEARVWSRPDVTPSLLAAAIGPETAAASAAWADGLITASQPPEALRRVLGAYRDAGGTGPACLQVHLSWAPTEDEALAIAHEQWRHGLLAPPLIWEIEQPEDFDARTAHADPAELRGALQVSSDASWHLDRLAELAALGFDRIYLHHVGQEQNAFLDVFGERVLPALRTPAARDGAGT